MWLLLACVPPSPPVSEPEPVVYPVDPTFTGEVALEGATVTYYAVTGRTDIEVLGAIRTTGPRVADATHGAATTWDVRWTWPDGGACAPVDVTAAIVVTFPRWDPPPDAPAASIGNWHRYVKALAVHEQGHVDRVRGVVAQMPGVLGAAGCERVAAAGREALDLIGALQREYDADTKSGEAQGAVLFAPRPLGAPPR